MPAIEVDIELYCDTCGEGICGLGVATYKRGQPSFRIEACRNCMSRAESKGDDAGYARGYNDGYEAARKDEL
jgi:hypothetical protein